MASFTSDAAPSENEDVNGSAVIEPAAEAEAPAETKASKKKKPKASAATEEAEAKGQSEKEDKLTHDQLVHLIRRSRAKDDAKREHKFWNTQPVPQLDETPQDVGPIDEPKTIEDVRSEPYNMPAGFSWCTMDVFDAVQIREIYTLLNENYVEDDDNMFRFDYSEAFLQWALTPPGYSREFHVGVRNSKTGKLMGFITGVPAHLNVLETVLSVVEINFLCVHKKLRTKRLAPVLIKEVTRRVNLTGVWQAVYTAGVVLPKPVSKCRYWHRSLNPKKLIEIQFSRLQPRMTLARTIKLYKLPSQPETTGLRQMRPDDVPKAHALLSQYLSKFKLFPVMSLEEFAHWLLPREGVVDSYVVEDSSTLEITDMISFYHLPSTVIGNPKHSTLYAAYSFYNVATRGTFEGLMNDALTLARDKNCDVFNALDLMDNKSIFAPLKFGIGDGNLQYYLYNWRCPGMEPHELGLVLL